MQAGTKTKTKLRSAARRPPFPLGRFDEGRGTFSVPSYSTLRRKEGGSPGENPIEDAHIAATAAAIHLLAERWMRARERAQVVPELILSDAMLYLIVGEANYRRPPPWRKTWY
jgi:hypothetical protein